MRRCSGHTLTRVGRIRATTLDHFNLTESLAYVAEKSLHADETVTESKITEHLARVTADPAALRRYLVDVELVVRTNSGST